MTDASPWPIRLRLGEIQRSSPTLDLDADEGRRTAIARTLDLLALDRFTAQVQVRPWLDGAEVVARWQASIRQTCGVSLEPFDTALSGEFTVKVVPVDSPAAGTASSEVSIDPEAEDPPDLLEGEEIDPFPREPGAAFEPPAEERPASPFAVLKALQTGADEPE